MNSEKRKLMEVTNAVRLSSHLWGWKRVLSGGVWGVCVCVCMYVLGSLSVRGKRISVCVCLGVFWVGVCVRVCLGVFCVCVFVQ